MLLLIFLLLVSFSWFSFSGTWKRTRALYLPKQKTTYTKTPVLNAKLEEKVAAAKSFVQKKNFNETTCFLIDMSLSSGQNRFFIYDLKKDSLLNSGLVAHGNCYQNWLQGRQYSNRVGSGCTSLGKYKIANSYNGKFGLSFKLHGLDSTNNKAFERYVVLHSHSCVPDTEVSDEICQSNGCPTVSPGFLNKLKEIISHSSKPVLLWIYE